MVVQCMCTQNNDREAYKILTWTQPFGPGIRTESLFNALTKNEMSGGRMSRMFDYILNIHYRILGIMAMSIRVLNMFLSTNVYYNLY